MAIGIKPLVVALMLFASSSAYAQTSSYDPPLKCRYDGYAPKLRSSQPNPTLWTQYRYGFEEALFLYSASLYTTLRPLFGTRQGTVIAFLSERRYPKYSAGHMDHVVTYVSTTGKYQIRADLELALWVIVGTGVDIVEIFDACTKDGTLTGRVGTLNPLINRTEFVSGGGGGGIPR
jgi:hypothetical protein